MLIKNVSIFLEVIDVRRSVQKDFYAMNMATVKVCTVQDLHRAMPKSHCILRPTVTHGVYKHENQRDTSPTQTKPFTVSVSSMNTSSKS